MILNCFFDFILLLSVSIILKRNVSIYRILFGSFIGGLSILFLFINISSFLLFIFKIIISILMIVISFGYKNFNYTFKNFIYLYMNSMVLGGVLYFLNVEFSYKQVGLIFINNGLSINFIFLVITSPIIIYTYIKQIKILKNNYNSYYDISIFINNISYNYKAFLDTGNNLFDPVSLKPVILVDKPLPVSKFFYIPYKVVNNSGIIKCFKPDKVIINNKEVRNVLIAITDNKIKIDGVDCLLNKKILEGLWYKKLKILLLKL